MAVECLASELETRELQCMATVGCGALLDPLAVGLWEFDRVVISAA